MNKTILIFSEHSDYTTNDVIDWISYFDSSIEIDRKNNVNLTGRLDLNDQVYHSIWYRRIGNKLVSKIANDTDTFILSELTPLYKAYLKSFSSDITLGTADGTVPNKLLTLRLAKSIGLQIPNTIVTTSKSDLLQFYLKNNEVIFKCISDGIILKRDDQRLMLYTTALTKDMLDDMEDEFFPTLFQKRIKKEYEIRTFYFDQHFYSMAIFSAKNKKTEVDFREYDFESPNRTVRYQLPKEIELKLMTLMKKMELNTGSIDIMKSTDGKYYFLEINPIGQFGNVSKLCNYSLEQKIAKYLISK